jgi:hypothetical protein
LGCQIIERMAAMGISYNLVKIEHWQSSKDCRATLAARTMSSKKPYDATRPWDVLRAVP